MLEIALIVVVVAIVAMLSYAATRPDTFRIERSASIKAPPEKIFALINDFQSWSAWSPWENKDPAMKRTYGGPANGKGATYAWEGNKNVGVGSMEILDATAPSRIKIRLDFAKPFEAHNFAEFTLSPQAGETNVLWVMHGPQPFLGKVMCLFMNMDKMVGKDFEAGLANLKKATQT